MTQHRLLTKAVLNHFSFPSVEPQHYKAGRDDATCPGKVVTPRSNGNNRKVPAKQAYSDSLSHLLAQPIHGEMSFLSMGSRKDLISLTATADLH